VHISRASFKNLVDSSSISLQTVQLLSEYVDPVQGECEISQHIDFAPAFH